MRRRALGRCAVAAAARSCPCAACGSPSSAGRAARGAREAERSRARRDLRGRGDARAAHAAARDGASLARGARVRARDVALARVVVVAFAAHALAVIAAGGDWMPYARLMVPVAPSLVIAFVELVGASRLAFERRAPRGGARARRAARGARGAGGTQRARRPRGRSSRARGRCSRARTSWRPSTSGGCPRRPMRSIVDLAGLTDASIAMLPGGHTSKRVDTSMLLDRGVDTVVVYSDIRVVERAS